MLSEISQSHKEVSHFSLICGMEGGAGHESKWDVKEENGKWGRE
jgi:hypothetical protein